MIGTPAVRRRYTVETVPPSMMYGARSDARNSTTAVALDDLSDATTLPLSTAEAALLRERLARLSAIPTPR